MVELSALGRKLSATLIAGLILAPSSAIAQEPRDQHDIALGRRFGEDYAQAIVANRRDYLYSHVAQRVQAAYPQEEFFKPLDLAKQYFGEIQTIRPTTYGVGYQSGTYGKIDTLSYEYAIATTKNLSGLFLRVQIERSDLSHGFVAYYIGRHLSK